MSEAVKYILSAFWLLVLPVFMGVPLLKKNIAGTVAESFLFGYLAMFSVGEVMTLIFIALNQPLHILVFALAVVFLALAVLGIVELVLKKKTWQMPDFRQIPYFYLILALALIGIQIYTLVVYAHFDADDSFYVGTATTGAYTDTIFSVDAYTGRVYGTLPKRYLFSQFPMFAAIISKLSLGLHPATLAHTVFPAVFLCITYSVQYQLARSWFPEKAESRGIYFLMVAVMTSFSAYSIKNAAEFQMVRIWQGKGLLAAAFLPMLFWLLWDFLKEDKRYRWWILLLMDLSCCYLSSMGIVLALVVFGICLFLHFILHRSLVALGELLLCMLPSLILCAAYVTF